MGDVLKADASVGASYVQQNVIPSQSAVWLTSELGYTSAGITYWVGGGFNSLRIAVLRAAAAALRASMRINGSDVFDTQTATLTASGGTPSALADGWHLYELHYLASGTVDLYIDGVLLSALVAGSGNIETAALGQESGSNVDPAAIIYIKGAKIGTTRGGSDIASFADGDLGAWSAVVGDVTVVADPWPTIAPPTQVFGGTRFYEAPPWRMIVGDLEDNTLTFLDRLALDSSITVTRAAARVISGRVPSDNPEINIPAPPPDDEAFVSEGIRLVSCFRREAPAGSNEAPWVIRARGIILSLTDDADTDHATSTFTAYDPWKYLYRRPVLQPNGSMAGTLGDVSYVAGTRASEIIQEQLEVALLSGGTIFTDFGQTAFYTGTIEPTEPLPNLGDGLAMTFRSGTTIGEMLDLLVATGTCDVVFDPIYDVANRPGLLCQLSVYEVAGQYQGNAIFAWDRWPGSLVQLSRQVEGTERANKVQMYAGQGGPPVPEEDDATSLARFGEYWALQYLPGVPSLAGAHTIAQRQLALLKDGQYTYALSPASERAPLLFEEYREADTLPVYASKRFRDPITGVPVRVESIPIVIGDDELERVNQMLVSFAPESGS